MRPTGTYGEVLDALVRVYEDHGPMTKRQAAAAANISVNAARDSINNDLRFRHRPLFQEVGKSKPARGTRWESIYELAPQAEEGDDECRHGHGWVDLGRVVGGWAR